jgi:hypothetical protein
MAEEVLEKMQKGLNTWEGLVKAMAEHSATTKAAGGTSTLPLITKATGGTKRWKKMEGKLTTIGIDGTQKALMRLNINESFETLGVQLNPVGNDDAVFEDTKKWAKDW